MNWNNSSLLTSIDSGRYAWRQAAVILSENAKNSELGLTCGADRSHSYHSPTYIPIFFIFHFYSQIRQLLSDFIRGEKIFF